MNKTTLSKALLIGASLLPASAMAHTGHEVSGLMAGLTHPLLGLDHLLAMLAVGLWAAKIGGKALWQLPATFVGMMLLSAVLATAGVPFPFVEAGISASVIIAGLLVAFSARFSATASTALVAAMAVFHGAAHGAELPSSAMLSTYLLGFSVATMALHLAGIGLILKVKAFRAEIAGGLIALTGIVLAV
ncbi:HupE/UreJ family protein [Oceanospirillum sp. HFRX-1_2]